MGVMGDVLPYRPPKAREETTAYLGMVIFLASWAMMFATLFFAYAYVRVRVGVGQWPPAGLPQLPLLLPGVNTAVIALSSAAMQYGLYAVRRGSALLGPALLLSVVLGAIFLGLQAWLWVGLYAQGLRTADGGPYASVFYALTCFHALHVAVGLLGIGAVCRRAFAGAFSAARHLPVRLWTMYWHFVGIVWALMFVSVFVM